MKDGFDFSELDEYKQVMLEMALHDFRIFTVKFMKDEAKDLVKLVEVFAGNFVGKKTGNYKKGFKKGKTVYRFRGTEYNIMVFNAMPHSHLIEDGYMLTTNKPGGKGNGKPIRFIPGKHVLGNAAVRFEPQFNREIEDKLVQLVKEELEK